MRRFSDRRSFCFARSGGLRAALLTLASLISLAHSQIAIADFDKDVELVYGAGPSTSIVKLFFEHFSQRPEARGKAFSVPERSVKHKGGIRASGQHLFGRTGRPLSPQEKAQNKFEIYLGRIPVGFVTGTAVALPPLKPSDIDALFSGRIANWKALGGPNAPVVLVGREKTEAVLTVLSRHFPVLLDAVYQQRFKRDHAVVNFLLTPAGRHAMGFGALSNFDGLNRVELVGPQLGVRVGLVVDEKNANRPLVKAVQQYAASGDWRQVVEDAGYFVVDDPYGSQNFCGL